MLMSLAKGKWEGPGTAHTQTYERQVALLNPPLAAHANAHELATCNEGGWGAPAHILARI